MQRILVITILMNAIIGCSSKKTQVQTQVPRRLMEVYAISKQTSYALLDAGTAASEIRLWELPSRVCNAHSMFLKERSISTQYYYLACRTKKSGLTKVIGIYSGQERILDEGAERTDSIFIAQGGPALTCRKGVKAAIDSLFKLGFAKMESQPEEESMRVGDGTEYLIEVSSGRFYKYVYYHNPEFFNNERARKFISVYHFLSQERWRNEFSKTKL